MPTPTSPVLDLLSRTPLVTVDAYCHGADCAVRTVTFSVKDYDHECRDHLAAGRALSCPVCGAPLVVTAARSTMPDPAPTGTAKARAIIAAAQARTSPA